ncbi:hypothetical protein ACVDG8_004510 [Mesorhizobium sp. ORM8.1]
MIEHPASLSAFPAAAPALAAGIAAPPTSISEPPASISALIDRWQGIGAFAADVGCGYEAARQMRRRGRIAPQHWPHVVAASRRRGIDGITYEWLAGHRIAAMPGEAA